MSRDSGVSADKLSDVDHYADSALFDERERVALEYADAITLSDRDVADDLFRRLRVQYTEEQVIELTATICWENMLSKFHHALLIESQGFYQSESPSDTR